jgi:hypothetical protein
MTGMRESIMTLKATRILKIEQGNPREFENVKGDEPAGQTQSPAPSPDRHPADSPLRRRHPSPGADMGKIGLKLASSIAQVRTSPAAHGWVRHSVPRDRRDPVKDTHQPRARAGNDSSKRSACVSRGRSPATGPIGIGKFGCWNARRGRANRAPRSRHTPGSAGLGEGSSRPCRSAIVSQGAEMASRRGPRARENPSLLALTLSFCRYRPVGVECLPNPPWGH